MESAFNLTAWYSVPASKIDDINFTNPLIFNETKKLVDRNDPSLDLSDAFQILSLKAGYFSHLIKDSQTVLVTADKRLAIAARVEGLKVWCVMSKSPH